MTIYRTARAILAFLTSAAVSSENVENVVKPPQMPTFKNKISRESRFEFFAARQAMTPIASEPKTLIKKVFIGKPEGFFIGIRPTKYLRIEPTKPPSPTKIQLSIIFLLFLLFSDDTKY